MMYTDPLRSQYFADQLSSLNNASKCGFENLAGHCQAIGKEISKYLLPPRQLATLSPTCVERDTFSNDQLPSNLQHLMPIRCSGDGNCLFR